MVDLGGDCRLVRRLLLGLALVLATVAGGSYLHRLRDLVPVVVTTEAVPARTLLTADKLAVRQVNRAAQEIIAPRAIQRTEDAVGLITRSDLAAGQPLQRDPRLVDTAPDGADASLPRYQIPDGMRLTAVRLDTAAAVAGRITPGDRVDVIFTSKESRTGGLYAQTILQTVEVFSVGAGDKSTSALPGLTSNVDIILLVTPEQAQILALAKRSGGSVDLSIAPPNPMSVTLPPTWPPQPPERLTTPTGPAPAAKQTGGASDGGE
jgi:Flp pilus assembly protein CpaB